MRKKPPAVQPSPLEDWLSQPDGLADRLRALRTQAGLTGIELAEAAGNWQQSKVSRIENGRQMPTVGDIEAWCRVCQVGSEVAQDLLRLRDEGRAVHRDWQRRTRRGQAPVQAMYNDLYGRSQLMRGFSTAFVPGLLQTPDYARRVFTEMAQLHGVVVDDVDAAVATRLARQRFLYDTGKRFEFVLGESVLRWQLMPAAESRAQLDRLLSVIGLPNVRLGVLPFGRPLATAPQNSFQLYDDFALVETFVGETSHTDDQAATYARVMDLLWQDAATGEDARQLIIAASAALPDGAAA